MAQLAKILLLFLCEYLVVISGNDERTIPEVNLSFEETSQFVLDFLNADSESDHIYNSAVITGKQRQNNSEQYLVTVIVSAQCQENFSSSCNPAELVCEVLLNDEPGSRSISHKICAPREQDVVLPSIEQGFTEMVGEKMALVAPDILTLDTEDSTQFLVVDVMSVKEWMDENGTSIYFTVKATKNDGSDTLQFVVCEFMNGTSAERTQCFPLEADHHDIVPDGENVTEVAKAVELLNKLSPSRYLYALRSLLNIEKIVTPGSNGVLTTLRVILAPTLCLKRLEDDAVVERLCSPSENGSAIVCTTTLWDRPWSAKQFLHSVPDCHLEERQVSSTLDPLLQATATVNKQPVVEEPFVVHHTFCAGCPTALNVDTPGVRGLVEQSLNLLDEGTGSIYKHALVRIVKAEKQVVNGVKYNIYLDVGESSCLKGSPEDRSICPLNNMGGDAIRTCHFEFTEQAWLRSGRQLSDSNCTSVYKSKNDNNELDNEIEPHSLDNAVRQSIYDYLDAAMDEPSFSLKEISPSFRDDSEEAFFSSRRLSLIDDEIIPEEEGSSTSPAEMFTSTEPGPTLTSTDNDAYAMRTRRATEIQPLAGILKNIDDSEKDYIEQLAYQAVETLDEIDADDAKRVVTEVIDAQKQLVDGIMYYLKLKVVSTGCKEDTARSKNDCLREQIAPTKICTVQLHKAFSNTSPKNVQVVKAECFIEPSSGSVRQRREVGDAGVESKRRARSRLTGGYSEISVNSEAVRNATDLAVAHLSELASGDSSLILVNVKHARQQLVSGTNTQVTIEVGVSNCTKAQARDNEVCVLKEGEQTKECTVVVWDQPWTKTRKVTRASCDESGQHRRKRSAKAHNLIQRSKRGVPGGYNEITDFDLVQDDALFAIAHMEQQSNDDSRLNLVQVKGAFRQVVAGTNTKLILIVGPSNCSKSEEKENKVCVLKEGEATKECTVVIFKQPWSNITKVTEETCVDSSHDRRRRFIEKRGNWRDFNVVYLDSDHIKKATNIALDHLAGLYDNEAKPILLDIVSAQQHVVVGSNARLVLKVGFSNCSKSETEENEVCVLEEGESPMVCTFLIFVQPHTYKEAVKDVYCDDHKRQVRDIAGGYYSIEKTIEDVQKAAKLGLVSLAQGSNSPNKLKVIEILAAQQQIVAGTNTEVRMKIGETTCLKDGPEDVETCILDETKDTKICTVVLFQQLWTHTETITSASCDPVENNQRKKRKTGTLLGAPADVDVNDPTLRNVANFALGEIDKQSNSLYSQQLVEIVRARKQVVAGVLYMLDLRVGYSNCRKRQGAATKNCELKDDLAKQICSVEVWDRPWLKERKLSSFKCSAETSTRSKRETEMLEGAPTDTDVNDPALQEIADFALGQIDKQSNNLYSQQLVKIVRARKQMVAGTLYSLDLSVGYSNCRKRHNATTKKCELQDSMEKQICSVEVLDVPWLKERTLKNFSCKTDRVKRSKQNSKIGQGSHGIHFSLFKDFMNIHKKQYKDKSEMKRRFQIFRANMKKVQRLQETEQGTAKYGPTRFADLTSKEFKALHKGLNPSLRHENSIPMPHAEIPDISLPTEFDWRHYNAVTEVKDQGSCGSCWAFSVTGNVEGLNAIRTGKLVSFSEQELVDCDTLDNGCGGGLPDNAYRALEAIGGLETEKAYPYEGENEKCHFNRSEAIVQVRGGLNISSNETKIAQWLVKNGPIAIGINANAMQFYMGGVSHPWKFLCRGDDLDHGVLIVGYGVHTYPLFNRTLPFWTIKNSWGSSWGEQGYYRVYRGDGTCGVNQMASSAILV